MNPIPLISVDNLTVQIRRKDASISVVKNVSFELYRGKALAIVGGSGSGKTLTCLSLVNLLPQQAYIINGSIRLNGLELRGLTESQMRQIRGTEVAYLPQNPMSAFHPMLTIGKHFVETIKTHLPGMNKKSTLDLALHYLDKTGLRANLQLLESYSFQLSGGMLQRAMLALGLVLSPSVLIADEPTSSLDDVNRKRILELLLEIKEEHNSALLIVSHELNEVRELADEVMVLQDGEVMEKASVDELFLSPQQPYTRSLLEGKNVL